LPLKWAIFILNKEKKGIFYVKSGYFNYVNRKKAWGRSMDASVSLSNKLPTIDFKKFSGDPQVQKDIKKFEAEFRKIAQGSLDLKPGAKQALMAKIDEYLETHYDDAPDGQEPISDDLADHLSSMRSNLEKMTPPTKNKTTQTTQSLTPELKQKALAAGFSQEDITFLASSKNKEAKEFILTQLKLGQTDASKGSIAKLKTNPNAEVSELVGEAADTIREVDTVVTKGRADGKSDKEIAASIKNLLKGKSAETRQMVRDHYNTPESKKKHGNAFVDLLNKVFIAIDIEVKAEKAAVAAEQAKNAVPIETVGGAGATQVSADASDDLGAVLEQLQETNASLRESISSATIVEESNEINEAITEKKEAQKQVDAKQAENKDQVVQADKKMAAAKADSKAKLAKIKNGTKQAVKQLVAVLTVLKGMELTPEVKAEIVKLEAMLAEVSNVITSGTSGGLTALADTAAQLSAIITIIQQQSTAEIEAVREVLAAVQTQIAELQQIAQTNVESIKNVEVALANAKEEATAAPSATAKMLDKFENTAEMEKRAELKKLLYSSGISTMPQLSKKMDALIQMAGTKEAALTAIEQLLRRISAERMSEGAALNEAAKLENGINKGQGVKVAEKLSPVQKLRASLDNNDDFKTIYSGFAKESLAGVSDKLKLELAIKALKNVNDDEKEGIVGQLKELGVSDGVIKSALNQTSKKTNTEIAMDGLEGGSEAGRTAAGLSGKLGGTKEKGSLGSDKEDLTPGAGKKIKKVGKSALAGALNRRKNGPQAA
jgi:hypothetical protein